LNHQVDAKMHKTVTMHNHKVPEIKSCVYSEKE